MTAPTTPYTPDLAGRDPLAAIRESIDRVRTLTSGWPAGRFERSYAPGKWSARQLFTHLAQTELALGTRARMALGTPAYVAQAFDQDTWIDRDSSLTGPEAVDAFVAIARMNGRLFEALSAAERATPLTHPEYGILTVDWILHQLAGHQIHHLEQLERIL
ncbi:MAG: DinB family protein [Acidobacteriota bacterium]